MTEKSKNEERIEEPIDELLEESSKLEDVTETPVEESASETDAATDSTKVTDHEDYKDQYLRLRADFENFRKRTRKEKEEWTQRCLENLCNDLLTVLDHFDLGIDNAEGKEFTEDTLKGFELVRGQLDTTLGKYGLSSMVATEGVFDPNHHEAITHMPSPDVVEGEIVAMTRKGYQLGNRQLRPAQVVVSAGPPETAESEGDI